MPVECCRDCTERKIGCHIVCVRYKYCVAEYKARMREIDIERKKDIDARAYAKPDRGRKTKWRKLT